ncbi:MAG: adenosylcobalamin-dependent ribonucleoside-diphosphate reductase [Halobacteria archaeon]|nr:adenosylcobalamin-dependent ribonucleoside-diphosphate reductase [Halobacteria archaeon]
MAEPESELDEVAETVLRKRYLRQDEKGEVVETPDEMFGRVASNVSKAEKKYGGRDREKVKEEFYEAISSLDFLPNSPTLMNAGTQLQQLAACFVLPVEDSIESIFEAVKQTALVHQSGGGTGFSFSEIRPEGDVVKKTGGVASGPVSFMKIFDAATEQIKQGGRRRGANMGVLDYDHPDIRSFISEKRDPESLRNFNISVATDEDFWEAYQEGDEYPLINPRNGEKVDSEDPEDILDLIAEVAWETGDPGVLFLDTVNDDNPIREIGEIKATNPCGEVPELPYEACVLGSVNLSHMTDGDGIDWENLEETVRLGVRFLDDCIEMSEFPVEEIRDAVERNRRLGLGVMGFHDALVDLGISYDSDEAVEFGRRLMEFVSEKAWDASENLADERGVFPNWEESTIETEVRNLTTTTIAPTGSISLIAGSSASIEPIYNVAYEKNVMGGLEVVNDRFIETAKRRGFYSEDLIEKVEGRATIQDIEEIPDDVKRLFETAHDVPPERHIEIQAAFQENVDNAVSKTVNLPESATVRDVKEIFVKARELGVKGVTVFRTGSKRQQVLGESPLKEECGTECEWVRTE